jgi:hypothetical protein
LSRPRKEHRLIIDLRPRDYQRLQAIAHSEHSSARALAAIAVRELVEAYFAVRPRVNGKAREREREYRNRANGLFDPNRPTMLGPSSGAAPSVGRPAAAPPISGPAGPDEGVE